MPHSIRLVDWSWPSISTDGRGSPHRIQPTSTTVAMHRGRQNGMSTFGSWRGLAGVPLFASADQPTTQASIGDKKKSHNAEMGGRLARPRASTTATGSVGEAKTAPRDSPLSMGRCRSPARDRTHRNCNLARCFSFCRKTEGMAKPRVVPSVAYLIAINPRRLGSRGVGVSG